MMKKKSIRTYLILFLAMFISVLVLSTRAQAATKTITAGKSVTVSVSTKATWTVSNKTVIKLQVLSGSKSAKITGLKAGTSVVTAKIGRASYKINITVKAAAKVASASKSTTSKTTSTKTTSVSSTAVKGSRDSIFRTDTGRKVTGHYVDSMANTLMSLTNQYRKSINVRTLTIDSRLIAAARVRAYESAVRWGHTRPNGKPYYTVNARVMYGENLAYGYSTAAATMNAWKKSPSHLANLKRTQFKKIGIAVVAVKQSNGSYVNYIAQEFG